MTYMPRGQYSKSMTLITAIVLFLIGLYINSNYKKDIEYYVYACIVIIASVRYIILPVRWEKTIGKMIKNAPREDINNFIVLIDKYLPVLSRNKRILILKDDYGYISYDRWNNEKKVFLKNFSYIPLSKEYYDGLNSEQQSAIIDTLVDDYSSNHDINIIFSKDMRPAEYEFYCAEILNNNGWDARTTVATGDQGVDIIAERGGIKVAIQCKRYANPVGNKSVQEVTSGKEFWEADFAVVVTNSTYTISAKLLAKSQGVFLIHHEQLPDLSNIISNGIA